MDGGPRTMDNERRKAILAEVAKWSTASELEWYQFTVKDYMDEKGVSRSAASAGLNALVAAGRLKAVMVGGVKAYWRPEDEPKEA